MKVFFLAIFLILISLFLFEYKIVGQAVYGDGRYYWAFTRSLYFNHSLDISSEMAHYYSPESNNQPASFSSVKEYADWTQKITRSFSLGISVIWLPLYFLADVLIILLSSLGVHAVRNGYSDVYQITVGVGNIVFIVGGLVILFQLLKRWYPVKVVIPTLLLVLFATNLLYYGSLDVINSHPFSFLAVSVLLYCFFRFQNDKKVGWVFLQGVLVGLLAANRTQDALFIILPLSALFFAKNGAFLLKNNQFLIITGKIAGILASGCLLGYLPQLLVLSLGQGHFSLLPHTDQGFGLPSHFLGVLFDFKLGIVWFMPIYLIGVGGLYFLKKKQPVFFWASLALIVVQYLLISSWDGWHQAAYTMRYFISSLPLVAFGLAEVFMRLQKRFSVRIVYLLVSFFIFHQLIMIAVFKLFLQDPTNVGTDLSRSGKLKTEIRQEIQRML